MDDIAGRLVKCFAAVFPELRDEEIPAASVSSVGSWDSVAAVTLLSVVEEEFGVQIGMQDLESLISFERFLQYVRENKDTTQPLG